MIMYRKRTQKYLACMYYSVARNLHILNNNHTMSQTYRMPLTKKCFIVELQHLTVQFPKEQEEA